MTRERHRVTLPDLRQLSQALLRIAKSGEAVGRLTVWFTHAQLHRIFDPKGKICRAHPLEYRLAAGSAGGEKVFDLRLRVAPWHIDIRTPAQIKAEQDRDATIRRLQEARARAAKQPPQEQPRPERPPQKPVRHDDPKAPAGEPVSPPSPGGQPVHDPRD